MLQGLLDVCVVQKLRRQMRKVFKLRMCTVVMFASLPHAVNFFSKTSDQYNIVAAFLHFNTLQVVQFVQYTVRHNKYSPQTTNFTLDGSCSTIKISPSLLSFHTGCISLFFTHSNFIFV
jgi:hypothetical protein